MVKLLFIRNSKKHQAESLRAVCSGCHTSHAASTKNQICIESRKGKMIVMPRNAYLHINLLNPYKCSFSALKYYNFKNKVDVYIWKAKDDGDISCRRTGLCIKKKKE